MQARRAARELALILFSQTENSDWQTRSSRNFQEIIMSSVRTLTNSSMEDTEAASKEILSIKNFIKNYQADHPKNLERPLESSDKPVPLPMTDKMTEKLDALLEICEKTALALEIAEMAALKEHTAVKDYIKRIIKTFKMHKDDIDGLIGRLSDGWDINRIYRMDKDILRIACTELLYIKETPVKAVINEAVELAKKYSEEESASFVNGILAKAVLENDLK